MTCQDINIIVWYCSIPPQETRAPKIPFSELTLIHLFTLREKLRRACMYADYQISNCQSSVTAVLHFCRLTRRRSHQHLHAADTAGNNQLELCNVQSGAITRGYKNKGRHVYCRRRRVLHNMLRTLSYPGKTLPAPSSKITNKNYHSHTALLLAFAPSSINSRSFVVTTLIESIARSASQKAAAATPESPIDAPGSRLTACSPTFIKAELRDHTSTTARHHCQG